VTEEPVQGSIPIDVQPEAVRLAVPRRGYMQCVSGHARLTTFRLLHHVATWVAPDRGGVRFEILSQIDGPNSFYQRAARVWLELAQRKWAAT